jgi:hypothetical protein
MDGVYHEHEPNLGGATCAADCVGPFDFRHCAGRVATKSAKTSGALTFSTLLHNRLGLVCEQERQSDEAGNRLSAQGRHFVKRRKCLP